jgi:hypothetical protein
MKKARSGPLSFLHCNLDGDKNNIQVGITGLADSVVDPYPDSDWIQWGPWIRTQEGNNDPRPKLEKIEKFHVLKCWM